MSPLLVLKVIGVLLATFVFWHFWAIYGLLLGVAIAMIMLP